MCAMALFYMWDPHRKFLIDSHNFYIEQAQRRLISQFDDINKEVDEYSEKWLDNASQYFDPEREDLDDYYESAYEEGIQHGILLSEMRDQTIFSVIAGMYHQWDKALREWMVMDARHWGRENVFYKIWKVDINRIFDLFESLGWKVRSEEFFHKLDACRLIVNIYKHGNGDSVQQLRKRYPEYFHDYESQGLCSNSWFDHNSIIVRDEHLKEFSDSIVDFWRKIPEEIVDSAEAVAPDWLNEALIADRQGKKVKR